METRRISLALNSVQTTKVGATVIGRSCDESIRIHDVFDLAYKLDVKVDAANKVMRREYDPREIRVTVVAIRVYGRDWHELEPGMSGELDLEGPHAKTLSPIEVLANSSNKTRLFGWR